MLDLLDYQDVAVLNLSGELGSREVEILGKTLFSLFRKKKTKVVLNFEEVDHVHYSSIPLLVDKIQKLQKFHGDFKFAGMSEYNHSIFRFVGATNMIESFDTVPDAVLSFRSPWRSWH